MRGDGQMGWEGAVGGRRRRVVGWRDGRWVHGEGTEEGTPPMHGECMARVCYTSAVLVVAFLPYHVARWLCSM